MKQFLTVIALIATFHCLAQHLEPEKRKIAVDLKPFEKSVVELYQRVLPAVVTVYTESSIVSGTNTNTKNGLGSGVLVSNECHILTAAHVVNGSTKIMVRTQDGVLRKATVLFSEPSADIALLKLDVKDTNLCHAIMGNSDELAVGQSVFAIGSPYGMENSFSSGIISEFRGFGKIYDGSVKIEFLQTDTALNSGNSGGPYLILKVRLLALHQVFLQFQEGFKVSVWL